MAEDNLTGFLIAFKHREVNDPAEFEYIRINKSKLITQFRNNRTADFHYFRFLISQEEECISIFNLAGNFKRIDNFRRKEFNNRTLYFATVPNDICHTFCPGSLRKFNHIIKELTRFASHFRSAHCTHYSAIRHHVGKSTETATGKVFADIDHFNRVTQIRLVRTETAHSFPIRNTRERRMSKLFGAELAEYTLKHPFDNRKDLVLFNETHFNVQLIEFAGRAVSSGIFVTETRSDLEIFVKTGNHQQLFELLRCLRQRIEFPRMQATGNQIVTGAFR